MSLPLLSSFCSIEDMIRHEALRAPMTFLYPTESRFLSSTVSSTSSFATFFMASTISVETERRCHLWINQQEASAAVGKDNSTLFLDPTWVNLENLTGLLQNLRSSVRKKHGKKKLQKFSCRHVPRKRRRRRKLNTSVRRDLQVTFPREQTKKSWEICYRQEVRQQIQELGSTRRERDSTL